MTYDKVKAIIAQQLRAPEEKITLDARLVEDLGADSANVMVLIMEVEDQFGIMVEDDAIMTLKTVDDVVKYIDSREGASSRAENRLPDEVQPVFRTRTRS